MTTPPDPAALREALSKFTAQEMRTYSSVSQRKVDYNVDDASYIGAQRIMAPDPVTNRRPSPFNAIPAPTSSNERFEAIAVHASIQPDSTGYGESYFRDDMAGTSTPSPGYRYQNYAYVEQAGEGPSQLSQVPTSTTNPSRPRTVAAGYDPDRQCLTVVFRDGTYYNYFNVNNLTWTNFKNSYSPGRFIKQHLDHRPRGYADASSLPEYAREALYRISATGQKVRQGVTGSQKVDADRRKRLIRKNYYKPGNIGGTARARAQRNQSA